MLSNQLYIDNIDKRIDDMGDVEVKTLSKEELRQYENKLTFKYTAISIIFLIFLSVISLLIIFFPSYDLSILPYKIGTLSLSDLSRLIKHFSATHLAQRLI